MVIIIFATIIYSNFSSVDNKETNIETEYQTKNDKVQGGEYTTSSTGNQEYQQSETQNQEVETQEEEETLEEQVELSTKHNVEIYINYEESTGLNYSDDAYVYLDNIEIGLVKNGESVVFTGTLDEGTHQLYLKRKATIRKYATNKIKFDVSKGNTVFSITAKENSISGLKISLN